jgi:hypothetical protein
MGWCKERTRELGRVVGACLRHDVWLRVSLGLRCFDGGARALDEEESS